MNIGPGILLALAMLLGNAFFVGAEFGLVSARRSNIELRALNGSRAAKAVLAAMERVSLMLAGAQLGVTLCSLVFGAVSEPLAARLLERPLQAAGLPSFWLQPLAVVVALCLMVYLHVVIGEMIPKNLSLADPTRAAVLLVPPLLLFVTVTRPVIAGFNAAANGCLRLAGIRTRQEIASSFSRDEVAGFVKESHREGLLSEEEEHLLSGTLDFEERAVQAVTVPLDKLVLASARPSAEEIEALTARTGFSRFPIAGKKGQLRGYVHIKDALQVVAGEHRRPLPPRLIRPLTDIKPAMSLRDALAAMQASGSHMAEVTNRRGRVLGVVMLEDLMEELVGSIRDDAQKQQRDR